MKQGKSYSVVSKSILRGNPKYLVGTPSNIKLHQNEPIYEKLRFYPVRQ